MDRAMSQRPWAVGVVVPARNEGPRVEACLASIVDSLEHLPRSIRAHVVLVADACDDETVLDAQRVLGRRLHAPSESLTTHEVVSVMVRNVGEARRAGAARLLEQLSSTPLERIWLMSTDADSRVPVDWVAVHLEAAEDGATAVAGIVTVDSFDGHPSLTAARFAATYEIRPDGTHPHIHGANLGVRADAYLAAGGWSSLRTGEDHCLWNRIRAHGFVTASTARSFVTTSGRRHGRAPDGFAGALRALVPERGQ